MSNSESRLNNDNVGTVLQTGPVGGSWPWEAAVARSTPTGPSGQKATGMCNGFYLSKVAIHHSSVWFTSFKTRKTKSPKNSHVFLERDMNQSSHIWSTAPTFRILCKCAPNLTFICTPRGLGPAASRAAISASRQSVSAGQVCTPNTVQSLHVVWKACHSPSSKWAHGQLRVCVSHELLLNHPTFNYLSQSIGLYTCLVKK